jgi:hypothetical protein
VAVAPPLGLPGRHGGSGGGDGRRQPRVIIHKGFVLAALGWGRRRCRQRSGSVRLNAAARAVLSQRFSNVLLATAALCMAFLCIAPLYIAPFIL